MQKKTTIPYWETIYQDSQGPSVFGAVSDEIGQLIPRLNRESAVLDLGCGDGRKCELILDYEVGRGAAG
jgi:hypothetical protein